MINDVAESAVLWALSKVMPAGIALLRSDQDQEKASLPCILLRAETSEEIINPGSDIHIVEFAATAHFHPKGESPEARAQLVSLLDNWAHNDPSGALSEFDGFHCYGFMPISGDVIIDTDRKVIAYNTRWRLWCTPFNLQSLD